MTAARKHNSLILLTCDACDASRLIERYARICARACARAYARTRTHVRIASDKRQSVTSVTFPVNQALRAQGAIHDGSDG